MRASGQTNARDEKKRVPDYTEDKRSEMNKRTRKKVFSIGWQVFGLLFTDEYTIWSIVYMEFYG